LGARTPQALRALLAGRRGPLLVALGVRDPIDATLEVRELIPEARTPRSEALGVFAELRDSIAARGLPDLRDPSSEADAFVAAFFERGLAERRKQAERAGAGDDDDARAVRP